MINLQSDLFFCQNIKWKVSKDVDSLDWKRVAARLISRIVIRIYFTVMRECAFLMAHRVSLFLEIVEEEELGLHGPGISKSLLATLLHWNRGKEEKVLRTMNTAMNQSIANVIVTSNIVSCLELYLTLFLQSFSYSQISTVFRKRFSFFFRYIFDTSWLIKEKYLKHWCWLIASRDERDFRTFASRTKKHLFVQIFADLYAA